MIGRSDGRQAFSNQEGIGSRLQHLLLDFFIIDPILLIDTGEKSDKLYGTIDGGDSVETEGLQHFWGNSAQHQSLLKC